MQQSSAASVPKGEERLAVSTRKIRRAFGDHVAVDDVTLEIRKGEIFGLIGPNGAGKTTLIKMLTTLLAPSAGGATVADHDLITDPRGVRASIGYVPQLLSADGALTARENLLVSARLYLVPHATRDARIAEALEAMGLTEAADRLVSTFSGGMIRRLEIAQSMLHEPEVIFMDEPTVGLDPIGRRGVWDLMRAIRRRLGASILMTTHLMDEAEAVCDRIGLLRAGRLEAVGTPAELKEKFGHGGTLDDVFFAVAAGEAADTGLRGARQTRGAERSHG